MRRALLLAVTAAVAVAPVQPARAGATQFRDVAAGHWAEAAIRGVAQDADWMRAFGTSTFAPDSFETRKRFAVALVRAFDRFGTVDPSITFTDVPVSDYAFGAMNVAVARGWMSAPGGAFKPNDAITKAQMDVALVNAIGLEETARKLATIQTEDGYRFKTPYAFGQLVIAAEMRFHYNQPGSREWREMTPSSWVRRAEAAYGLWAAANASKGWGMWAARKFDSIVLPKMDWTRRFAIEWAFQHAGWPYIYAGEWGAKTPAGYPYGAQPGGGFDCSGFVWWVLRSKHSGYQVPRSYYGWYLPDRSSATMGRGTTRKLYSTQLIPMDIVLFDSDGSGGGTYATLDHAGLYLGNGWMIHSSGGRGGVSISWMGDGFWRGAYYWGRRVIPGYDPPPPPPPPPPSPTPTPSPTESPSPSPDPSPAVA